MDPEDLAFEGFVEFVLREFETGFALGRLRALETLGFWLCLRAMQGSTVDFGGLGPEAAGELKPGLDLQLWTPFLSDPDPGPLLGALIAELVFFFFFGGGGGGML